MPAGPLTCPKREGLGNYGARTARRCALPPTKGLTPLPQNLQAQGDWPLPFVLSSFPAHQDVAMMVRAHEATALAHETQALHRKCQSNKMEGAMAPGRHGGAVSGLRCSLPNCEKKPSPFVQSILLGFQPHSSNCCTVLHAGFLPFQCHPTLPTLLPFPGSPAPAWATQCSRTLYSMGRMTY